jgi:hypothetical protein
MSKLNIKETAKWIAFYNESIGKKVQEVIKTLEKERYEITEDCIGYNFYRKITMKRANNRLEILCETNKKADVAKKILLPSSVEWFVIDIFDYIISKDQPNQEFE